MQIKDQNLFEDWQQKNANCPYGWAILRYGERWADRMEEKMQTGEKLDDIADDTSRDPTVDTEGITGFMYNMAVRFLVGVWAHGEALRQWHNRFHQLRNEGDIANERGGLLNTAIVNVRVNE